MSAVKCYSSAVLTLGLMECRQHQMKMHKIIKLKSGKAVILDLKDYNSLPVKKLFLANHGYPCFILSETRKFNGRDIAWSATVLVHRWVMSAPRGTCVDHINGNRLDARRGNLRLATKEQNMWNRSVDRRNITGFKGVNANRGGQSFSAVVRLKGKSTMLGTFSDAETAARAYDKGALERFGEFARLNFPKEDAAKFVPSEDKCLMRGKSLARGVYPSAQLGRFYSQATHPVTKRRTTVGHFDSVEEAVKARVLYAATGERSNS